MQLGLEIPLELLSTVSPLCDMDFALAQEVLDKPEYAEFYAAQAKKGRFVLLDNGFHELGRPLSSAELLAAATKIHPSAIIAPDWLGKPGETYAAFNELRETLKGRYRIAFVLCGNSASQRAEIFTKVAAHIHALCLPFKEPRLDWFMDLVDRVPITFKWPARIHLLGVNRFEELTAFRDAFNNVGIPACRTSVDTGKPMKFGLDGKRFDPKLALRGAGALKHDYKGATDKQLANIFYNVAYLRKHM